MDWAVEVHELAGGEKLLEAKWSKELAVVDVVLDGDSSIKDMKRGLLAIVL